MQIDYQYIAPATLTGYARAVPDPTVHVLKRFLPDRPVDSIEVLMDKLTRSNRAARFRTWDAETPIGKRPVSEERRVKLPPIGEKRVLGEWETMQLAMLQGVNPQVVANAALDDTADNVLAIYRRMELARGDLVTDGKFTITDEGGLKGLEADFGLPATHNVTAAVAWSDHTNAVPLDNLETWATLVAEDSGERPSFALLSSSAIGHMRSTVQVREAVGALGGTPSRVTPGQLAAVLEAEGLPTLVPYDTLITDWAGNSARVTPVDRVILLPPVIGYTAWGIGAEALALVQARQISLDEAKGIVAYCMTDGDAHRVSAKATAVAMPVIEDATRMLSADVL